MARTSLRSTVINGISKLPQRVLIVGGGFAGLNCAKVLGGARGIDVTLLDRRNHHLFQPLLYQVATAGLSPADIAVPIRAVLAEHRNIQVYEAAAERVDLQECCVITNRGRFEYDTLVLACGSQHTYFGRDEWEVNAPGLKTLEQATEIRRRVLSAFERAECEEEPEARQAWLTFIVVGGGPTGVELAGALGELSRSTLRGQFRRVDPKLTRVVLLEGGPRILPSFDAALSARATRDLTHLGVEVRTNATVTQLDARGVEAGGVRLQSKTVVWAAGVTAAALGETLRIPLDAQRRLLVKADLSVADYPNVFVAGDQARSIGVDGKPLPGVATVALQQGQFVGRTILRDVAHQPRREFSYRDKGQMATIGRRRAVLQSGALRLGGSVAWFAWLVVHIYYLSGFANRLLVLLQWAYSYFTFARGARLIVQKSWQFYANQAASTVERRSGFKGPGVDSAATLSK